MKIAVTVPNYLYPFWMPFTANRAFKKRPRLISGAKDMHYITPDGRKLIDGSAGLWCTNAGHNRDPIVQAIQRQAAELDYAPAFQFSHPQAFELASRIAALAPGDLDHVFFCNSGSEAVDTALKIALAYHNVRGQGGRVRLIGRERGYHGVGFGGIAVGGIVANRKQFGAMMVGIDHLPHTYNREQQAFTVNEPEWGAHLADDLERLVALHDASTIAAVIVEPVACSTGVLPPPKGYLKRLREICDTSGTPLIFDRVLTAHARSHQLRQGHHLGQRSDGRRDRAQAHPRCVHERAGARHRAVPRLHVLGASARLRRRPCDARRLPRRAVLRACAQGRAALGFGCDAAERPAQCARHPAGRSDRRRRSRTACRRSRQAWHRGARKRIPRLRPDDAFGRRHACDVAAPDRVGSAGWRVVRKARQGDQGGGLKL